jgi:hypothetical protein
VRELGFRGNPQDPTDFALIRPYCGTSRKPWRHHKIATAGWLTFVLLFCLITGLSCVLGLFWPLSFLGLFLLPACSLGFLIKDEYQECSDCETRLN